MRATRNFRVTTTRPSSTMFDTSSWVGAEYTPWQAPNELWWIDYARYRPTVDYELGQLKQIYGFNTLRVWLHTLHAHDAAGLKKNVSDFLELAHSHGFGVGLVLFDGCWNKEGGNLTKQCVPQKGHHNGCWMTSPQFHERTSIQQIRAVRQGHCWHLRARQARLVV